ncbi:unnamed protein product [Protopolystoma xenopodis]|uniref:Uncharacterized protein n=1 Tax=Protopolystoma xenopodis TaxID=117903 RepID=A0A3S5C053_9PLAT|nr:unnamed protein product [Protopolystoma xenopodis]
MEVYGGVENKDLQFIVCFWDSDHNAIGAGSDSSLIKQKRDDPKKFGSRNFAKFITFVKPLACYFYRFFPLKHPSDSFDYPLLTSPN